MKKKTLPFFNKLKLLKKNFTSHKHKILFKKKSFKKRYKLLRRRLGSFSKNKFKLERYYSRTGVLKTLVKKKLGAFSSDVNTVLLSRVVGLALRAANHKKYKKKYNKLKKKRLI